MNVWKSYPVVPRFIFALLFVICFLCLASHPAYAAEGSEGTSISMSAIHRAAEDYNMPDNLMEAFEDAASNGKISVTAFKKCVQKYPPSVFFIQKFFKKHTVYYDDAVIKYAPIDPELPKNTYDWDNLVKQKNGRIKYVKDDASYARTGIDVSSYQGNIDWGKAKADGVQYAILRAGVRGYGSGKMQEDTHFKKNLQNATKAGVPIGVYFFSQAINTAEAIAEAQFVIKRVKDYDLTYPIAIDVEDVPSSARTAHLTSKQRTDIIIAFCRTVKEAGYRPMVYSNSRWLISKMDLTRLKSYDKWFAQYTDTPFFPYKFQIWQYTGKGRVDGIQGNVDLNLCFYNYKKQ